MNITLELAFVYEPKRQNALLHLNLLFAISCPENVYKILMNKRFRSKNRQERMKTSKYVLECVQ